MPYPQPALVKHMTSNPVDVLEFIAGVARPGRGVASKPYNLWTFKSETRGMILESRPASEKH